MDEEISGQHIDTHTLSVSIRTQGVAITWHDFLSNLSDCPSFRTAWIRFLQNAGFSALRWECPPVDQDTLASTFACVLISSPGLIRPANPSAFSEWFARSEDSVCSFPSLRKDAQLIAPCPINNNADYAHLKAVMDTAPMEQSECLWKISADEVKRLCASQTVWLNTAGAGVPWLHIRLDSRPKYYQHQAYRALANKH